MMDLIFEFDGQDLKWLEIVGERLTARVAWDDSPRHPSEKVKVGA
jgi:hypothetical protein